MISANDLFDFNKLGALNARLHNHEAAAAEPIGIAEIEEWITAHAVALQTFGVLGDKWVQEEKLGPQLAHIQQNYWNFVSLREDLISRFVGYLDVYDRLVARDPESERAALRHRRDRGD